MKEKRTNKSQSLEELTLRGGKFVDSHNKPTRVAVLGVGMATPGSLTQVFEGDKIPDGANAFVKGRSFDLTPGVWSRGPRYVAPIVYLRRR